mmetsp:Transcript_39021/g.98832  ORF Transcript_39021/g.98832 Transcript_39021/m.98832 type:complete len:167 (-) Transcript_39021:1379-1879(-)
MPPGTPAHASVAGGAPEFQAQSPEAKPSAFDLMLLSDSIYGTFEEPNRHKERQCETLSVVVTYRVKPGMGEAFEAAAETLDDVVSSVVGDGFIGITIVRPFQGSNSYSTIVQFAKRTAMEEWLVSDARRGWAAYPLCCALPAMLIQTRHPLHCFCKCCGCHDSMPC